MVDWIYNEGSYEHRGVWHAVDGEIEYETIPRKENSWVSEIRQYHKRNCDSNRSFWDTTRREYANYSCSCGLGDNPAPIGTYTTTYVHPEHTIAYAKVQCSAFTSGWSDKTKHAIKTGGLAHRYANYRKKHTDGDVDIVTDVIRPPMIVLNSDEPPPGPFCSRCYNKVQKSMESLV